MLQNISNKICFLYLFIFTFCFCNKAVAFEIEQAKLKNGLEINVIENHKSPIISFMIWYKAGGGDDYSGKSGIAHFLEHLSFEGTNILKAGEYSKIISDNGGISNAFTGLDYTAYYENITKDKLDLVMFLAANRMKQVQITPKVFAKEKKVVLEERLSRYDNNPAAIFNEKLKAKLWQDLPYGRPIIGFKDEIENLSIEDVKDFYNSFYAPNNAIIVVSGDTTLAKVTKYAKEFFGKIPKSEKLPQRNWSDKKPKIQKSNKIVMQDERIKEPRLMKIYAVPSFNKDKSGKAYSLEVLNEILGSSLSSRLYKSLVMDKGKALSAYSFYSGSSFGYGTFGFYCIPKEGVSLNILQKLIEDEVQKIAKGDITDKEVLEAKQKITNQLEYLKDNPLELSNTFGALLSVGLTAEDIKKYPERIKAVTRQDIIKAAGLLNGAPCAVGYLEPAEKEQEAGK